jgi:phage head maturation protease
VIKDAELQGNKVAIKIVLDDPSTNHRIPALLNKLAKGIKLGLSVGGAVTKQRTEYDKQANKKINIIDGVKLYEVSVVGIPSNSDSFISLPMAIAKSRKSLNLNNKTSQCPCCNTKNVVIKCPLCLWSP